MYSANFAIIKVEPWCVNKTRRKAVNAIGNFTYPYLELPHCILVAFGGENYGKYARSLKRFAFIAIQYLLWLWTIPRNPKRWDYRIFICFIGNNSNSHDFTKHQVKSWLSSDLQYRISNIILVVQCISGAAWYSCGYRRVRWRRRPRALRCVAWPFRWLQHCQARSWQCAGNHVLCARQRWWSAWLHARWCNSGYSHMGSHWHHSEE